MRQIDLNCSTLRLLLNRVEKPGRYAGGEFGAIQNEPMTNDYTICVVFPDLYEIGMSNQALRILYKILNDTEGLHAERAFSPGLDFCQGLKNAGLKLYSLENRFEVRDFDLLAVTIGCELSLTNYMEFLESSGIPIHRLDRTENHPLVILGGPAVTNPAPWTDFVDAVFIGEAEGVLASSLLTLKRARDIGYSKEQLKLILSDLHGFCTYDSPQAERQVWMGFSEEAGHPAAFPIPSLEPVQDHGVIEIMRGCPNKCRFCHAGIFYRPCRQKPLNRIIQEAQFLVNECGYRDITLSSLSTGDYSELESLVELLNKIFSSRMISFSLPSLRVNSITLSLLGQLNTVRKSSLTFAVETPTPLGQDCINKEVPIDRVIAILQEAQSKGWKLAKFYFMLGLPFADSEEEPTAIINYLLLVQRETGMNLNVNLGTFIPKPHTPYERSAQLSDEQAMSQIRRIKNGLKSNRKIKISFHSPFASYIEGIISRGDQRAGTLAFTAWKNGARFDAWDDKIDKDAWRNAISGVKWDVEGETCREKPMSTPLPWDDVSLGITKRHGEVERQRSQDAQLTSPCQTPCPDHCGVCNNNCHLILHDAISNQSQIEIQDVKLFSVKRMLITFTKNGSAVYLGHLDVVNVFAKSIQRAGFQVEFTQGFNPKPRIEFAQPLPLGMFSEEEICSVNFRIGNDVEPSSIKARINEALPEGLCIVKAEWRKEVPEGKKIPGIMNAFWGSQWRIALPQDLDLYDAKQSIFEELDHILIAECTRRGVINDITLCRNHSDWIVRFRNGGTKHHNLKRLLEDVIGESPLKAGWNITRIAMLAKNTMMDSEPVNYSVSFADSQ